MSQSDIAAPTSLSQSRVQSNHDRVATADRGHRAHPQVLANQIVSLSRHPLRDRRKWIAFSIDTGRLLFGKDAEVAG
jgi:hypothetical protein